MENRWASSRLVEPIGSATVWPFQPVGLVETRRFLEPDEDYHPRLTKWRLLLESSNRMSRFFLVACLLIPVAVVGCGGGTKSFPEPADTPDVKAQIEAQDKKVDELEKGR